MSQMKATFTEQYAVEQHLEEKKRAEDAERLSHIKKAKNHVIGYGWATDHFEPTISEFQGGFVWPHFITTTDVLSDLDIPLDVNPSSTHIKLYHHQVHTWTKVSVGHVVTPKDGDRIFLKALGISHCLNFDDLLTKSLSQGGSIHIRNNLAGEHAFVRQQLKSRTSPSPEFTFSDAEPTTKSTQHIPKSVARSTQPPSPDSSINITATQDPLLSLKSRHHHLVFESPVRLGYWVPRGSNRDRDRLAFVLKPKIT
ncbi:uncharacterized protein LACBIDRAFT_310190 [Laccaria bicolor S238N-H82]|uniref:Predicted protein n=1 Tax=Laccaria bicolor (strain S238N-H82 / ATCC MYA-4686) TaxID=486041 RepID=B0DTP0_LACBS|nr:uncharacterized protein LACBIDRAFT_310190 [Laccaria bicolor S238N-H82]EDR02011.1 predicted protein [Laccaria bicolor S238N-H82]|eukprot:XP_001887402.1 predicted protein [Laccaria bicolor S238N-H82]